MIHLPAGSSRVTAAARHLIKATSLADSVNVVADTAEVTRPLSYGQQLVWHAVRSLVGDSSDGPSLRDCLAYLDEAHVTALIEALAVASGMDSLPEIGEAS